MASTWKLKAFNWMMQENMNVEEYQTVVSTPLLLLVSFNYASVVHSFRIIFVTSYHYQNNTLFRGITLLYD